MTTVTKKLEALARRLYHVPEPPNVLGQKFAYVLGFSEKGKKIFDGPFPVPIGMTESEEANAVLAEFPSGEIFILKTKDVKKAKQEVKAQLLARGENPDEAIKRMLKKQPKDETKKLKHKRFYF